MHVSNLGISENNLAFLSRRVNMHPAEKLLLNVFTQTSNVFGQTFWNLKTS